MSSKCSFFVFSFGGVFTHALLFWLFFAVICFIITLFFLVTFQSEEVIAWSFQDIWWFGETQSTSVGNVRIIYTYPDIVKVNETFQVGVTLQYIKDKSALSNWIAFSNVSVHLRPWRFPNGTSQASSEINASKVISPGEMYSHSFSLKANQSGNYIVALRLTSLFGPGGGALATYEWDAGDWYNKNKSEGSGGAISPNALKPINVTDYKLGNQRNLTMRFQKPFSQIITINATAYYKNNEKKDTKQINPSANDSVIFTLPYNKTYNVQVNKTIELVPNKVRGVFLNWSDGNYTDNRNDNNCENMSLIKRDVNLTQNAELLALYKTQYHLEVKGDPTDDSIVVNGEGWCKGWYDSGSQADYSSTKNFWGLLWSSFDHWTGDISSESVDASSGHLTIDGPKSITAFWKYDYLPLATIIAIIGAIASVLAVIKEKSGHKKENCR